MICNIIVLSALVLSIEAQFAVRISCANDDDACKNVLNTPRQFKCIEGECMCENRSSRSYERCSTNEVIQGGRQIVGLRRDCSSNDDCNHIEGAKCYQDKEKTRNVCDCDSHMVMSTDGTKCVRKVKEVGARCADNVQCASGLDGAHCHEGRCKCRPAFHFSQTKGLCILSKSYGVSCVKDDDNCYQTSGADGKNILECSDDNVCGCAKNYIAADGICLYSGASQVTIFNSFLIVTIAILWDRLF